MLWLGLSSASLVSLSAAADASAAGLSSEAKKQNPYIGRVEDELRDNILKFWIDHTVDHERGGFYGEITNDLTVRKDAPRGALLSCRILWTYAAAYQRYQDAAYLEMAQWAYDDLSKRFWDEKDGGFYWSITAAGKPQRTEKQVYGQAFGIYALAEYYKVSKDPAALEKAKRIYQLLQEHAHDPKFGGYFETFTHDWKPVSARQSVTTEGVGSKTQNTHLHVFEAFTNLLRVWPDEGLKKSQAELVDLMLTKIVNPKTHHLVLFMKDDWTPVSDGISFGHDIEASWLLSEAADVLGGDALRERVRKESVEIARVTLEQGILPDGSLVYEAGPKGITDTRREWWPQAEAAVGFYNAYQISGDTKYLKAAYRMWDFIDAKLVDHEHGEWFRAVSKDGRISREPKVSLWKCPYHNGRSCLELVERMEAMAKK